MRGVRNSGIALTLATGEQQQGGQGEQKNAWKTDVHDRAFQVISISFWAERPKAPKGSLRRSLSLPLSPALEDSAR